MPLKFKPGWNMELRRYATRFGDYQAFLSSFDENSIRAALFGAQGRFNHNWVRDFIKIAMDPFSTADVWVEQGTHQEENLRAGGFCLHFTGRDQYGDAFHFYIKQDNAGRPIIFEITFRENRAFRSVYRIGA